MLTPEKISELRANKNNEFVLLHSQRVMGKRMSRLVELLCNANGVYLVRGGEIKYKGDSVEGASDSFNALVAELKKK